MAVPVNIFPLRLFKKFIEVRGLSRVCQQRSTLRHRMADDKNSGVSALDWMYHTVGEDTPVDNHVHADVLDWVNKCVELRPPPEKIPSTEEAFRELLRGKSAYDVPHCAVAAYKRGQVSLPESVATALSAKTVRSTTARDYLCGFKEKMLRSTEEMLEVQPLLDATRPYMDVQLQRRRRTYVAFLNDLDDRGLRRWTQTPKERCSSFFVTKKSGALRLIMDCRRADILFKPPPGVSLCRSESFSRMEAQLDELEKGESPVMGIAYVEDYFHRIKINQELAEYFAMGPVSLAEWYSRDSGYSETDDQYPGL